MMTPEERNRYAREWRQKNLEKSRAYSRKSYGINRDKILKQKRDKHISFHSWKSMLARCSDKNRADYKYYGGRGITVCKKWLTFAGFLEDMGSKPSKQHSIDRKDNSKGYFKENCRWATRSQQMRNIKTNRWIEVFGRRMVVSDWIREIGMDSRAFYAKVSKHGFEAVIENEIKK